MKKVALITGASGGIGAAAAKLMSEHGFSVMLHTFKNIEYARCLCEEIKSTGTDCDFFAADLTNESEAAALINETIKRFGKIDCLVNNTGIAFNAMLADTSAADWHKVLETNVTSAYFVTRAANPWMVRQKSGSIINVSSIWGECGASCEVAYSTSKAALIGFTKALAKELAPSGITVNAVAPGVIDTKMNAALTPAEKAELVGEIPLGRFGRVEEIAATILFLATAGYITGEIISVNGGMLI